jgi:hypothetical protein
MSLIPVAPRSKVWVCGLSLAGIVGLNPSGGMDVCPTECGVSECDREASMMRSVVK